MIAADREFGKPGYPRISIFLLLAFGVVAIAVAGYVASEHEGKVTIVVPGADLPAYHRIVAGDLTTQSVGENSDDLGLAGVGDVVGRVAIEPLSAGDPISAVALTPVIKGPIGPVRLELQPEQAGALGLSAGDRVQLRSTPTVLGVRPRVIDALLLDVPEVEDDAASAEGGGSIQSYVVALNQAEAKRLMSVLGRSRLFIMPAG